MRLRAVLTIAFICFAAVPAARAAECKSTVNGDLRIHPLASRIFHNTRSIMAFGSEEVPHGEAGKQVQGFFATVVANFKAAGYDDDRFRYVYEQDAKHSESAWAKRLPDALKFLFGDWKPQPEAPDAGKQ